MLTVFCGVFNTSQSESTAFLGALWVPGSVLTLSSLSQQVSSVHSGCQGRPEHAKESCWLTTNGRYDMLVFNGNIYLFMRNSNMKSLYSYYIICLSPHIYGLRLQRFICKDVFMHYSSVLYSMLGCASNSIWHERDKKLTWEIQGLYFASRTIFIHTFQ